MRCLEKDPAKRYQDFASIQSEIEALAIIKRSTLLNNSSVRGAILGETDYLISKGITLITFGNIEDGVSNVENAISKATSVPLQLSTVAESLNRKGLFELGLKYANLVCEASPENSHALLNKSVSLSALGNPEEAIKCLDRILELDPNDAPAWSNKGMIYCDYLHKPDIALTFFDKAIFIDPKLPPAWTGRGVALSFLNRPDDAQKSWEQSLELDPLDYDTWLNFGGFLTDYLEKYQEAIKIFDQVIEANPNISRAWQFRGVALSHLNQLDDAMELYKKGLALDPNNEHCNAGIADILAISGRYVEALDHFQVFLNRHPFNVSVLTNIGICEMKLGNITKALYYFETALGRDPNNTKLIELVNYCRSDQKN